jgi:Tat protein secretion system quality control protein TatD with DNase activity
MAKCNYRFTENLKRLSFHPFSGSHSKIQVFNSILGAFSVNFSFSRFLAFWYSKRLQDIQKAIPLLHILSHRRQQQMDA